MIERIRFQNFRALRDAELPLGAFTLIVGPNGSGKSTALYALDLLSGRTAANHADLVSADAQASTETGVEVALYTIDSFTHGSSKFLWPVAGSGEWAESDLGTVERLLRARVYALDPGEISTPGVLRPGIELDKSGRGLVGVLDRLRDQAPERFEALNDELSRMLPEFDRILFETPNEGTRGLRLRARNNGHSIPASALSHGTLLALAILTLAYQPSPPSLLGIEEPDRGIHPRLLRDVRDALYRLSFPEPFGETRPPVQVVATTHSPYFLDLFKDHPEHIVIAQREGMSASFRRLVDHPDLEDILADAPLGEVWYSGVLGGVPVSS